MMMAGYFTQQPLAPRQHILPGCLEIAGIPRVGNIVGVVGVVHQEVQLAGKVAAADAVHIPQIRAVHANQEIVFFVVGIGELPSRVAVAGDPMLRQLAPCRRIDWVADLLPAGGRRLDMELRRQPHFLHQVLHHELGHGAAADISMTHKEYLLYRSRTPALLHFHQYSRKPPVRREKNTATPAF